MAKTPAQAFLSYAHVDDSFLNGGITWLHGELQNAVQALTGEPFEIFLDKDGIAFGEHWPSRLEEALIGARFLIPILTPSYFTSPACRAEAEAFLELESASGRRDRILPIYLIEADVLDKPERRAEDRLAQALFERQYANWQDAAFELSNAPRIKQRAFALAKQIKAASERVDNDAPPIIPEQGPGPRFRVNKDGLIDRAPDEPGKSIENDPRLCSLQDGLLQTCDRLRNAFASGPGQNAFAYLLNDVEAYRALIATPLADMQMTDVWWRGLGLQKTSEAVARDVERFELPLEDEQQASLDMLMTLHATFILSTEEGETLQAKADRYTADRDQRAELIKATAALNHAVQESVDLVTADVKRLLERLNDHLGDGGHPERQLVTAQTANRNLLTAAGEAATGKDFSEIGEAAADKAGRSASAFLMKEEALVQRLVVAGHRGLSWLSKFITWLGGQRAPASTVRPAVLDAPAIVKNDVWTPGRVFRDIDAPWCPEMVVIPPGEFMMGSPEDEEGRSDDEGPLHLVTIERPFALGRYPVTFEEYDFFCNKTKHRKPSDEDWGRGRRPVIDVSWEDANAYCDWLSKFAETRYRLPSEAEWEYACRAGATTAYAFGATIDRKQANFGSYVGKTSEVGIYPSNAWGIYDMHGNVREWCRDDYRESYKRAPVDGSAWLGTSSIYRVLRGGQWGYGAQNVRSAFRERDVPDFPHNYFGFRCVRVQE
jgi:formylglycine-generating enzyme required for sulfatase activity